MLFAEGRPQGFLAVHVDDGIWAGEGPRFRDAQAYIRNHLNVKKEHNGKFTFLGRNFVEDENGLKMDQREYLNTVKPIEILKDRRRRPEMEATPPEMTAFKSLVKQMAWPARNSAPVRPDAGRA